MKDIKSMLPEEIEEQFISAGIKKYKAIQVFSWLHKGVLSFNEMTDLSKELREELSRHFYISKPAMIKKQTSNDGTIKYLWGLQGDLIETVLMDYNHGTTVCISSQVGCKMACTFCASGIGGFVRNLTPAEMLDQVLFSAIESGKKISNCVLMGIGEPLDNFDNAVRFAKLICHPKGYGLGGRHLTLSTCGVIENIDRLADSGVKLSLAISLHAPDDETRTLLCPYNKKTGVKAITEAAKRYRKATGRRVIYEYAMVDGVNDSAVQARMLSDLLKGTDSHLNLIMLSPIAEGRYKPSKKENLNSFTDILMQNKVNFTTRRSLGVDIEASCGQLRRKNL